MAIYASFQARGIPQVELATLGAISAPLQSLANDQLFVARAAAGRSRPDKGRVERGRASVAAERVVQGSSL
ncbi:MAG: hypothetical protein JF607_11525 [Burkholderiales bacterium]|jgi:hypothetical protein|nr:hypothetical protein [Burkholderiales bacterium]